MDTIKAIQLAELSSGIENKVFDWVKAANIIKENPNKNWNAGLSCDLEWTGGRIWDADKKNIDNNSYTFLSSNWAIPVIYDDSGLEIECYVKATETEYGEETRYPKEFMDILFKD